MSNQGNLYPFLYSVIDDIEKHKVYIATSWVKRKNSSEIFERRQISLKKFRDGYGVPILEYFISVINETKPIGDCPIMSKLVHYLLKKDITPQEVFNICMDFRASLREFLFAKDEVLKKPLDFANEIAAIMEGNLSGVLGIFTDVYKNSQIKLQELESQKDKLLDEKEKIQEEKEKIQEDTSIDTLTGLINYVTFEKLIQEKVQEPLKDNQRMFLVLVDIPNLRKINLSKGNEAGDAVVHNIAIQLKAFSKEYIKLGRLAGGRFGILVNYSKDQEAYDWCVSLYKNMPDKDIKLLFCITEIDTKKTVGKIFFRAYDLIDEANTNPDIIINTDLTKVIPFKELSDQNEFINELRKINTLESIIYYKELPINNMCKIKEVGAQHIEITASRKQIKIAEIGKFIYFKTPKLGNVKANIQYIDEDRQKLSVHSFRFDIHSPLDRKLYRVKASEDFRAYIQDNNRDFDVKVLDMNNQYIAVEIDRKRNFDYGASFTLHVRMIIDGKAHNFETKTTIERMEKVLGGYKFVLLCNLEVGNENEKILTEYLASFQRNIIKDFQN